MDNGEVELDSTPTSYDTEERRSRADESRAEHPFDNIVGESRALRDALPQGASTGMRWDSSHGARPRVPRSRTVGSTSGSGS
jgi:hypothetical protein